MSDSTGVATSVDISSLDVVEFELLTKTLRIAHALSRLPARSASTYKSWAEKFSAELAAANMLIAYRRSPVTRVHRLLIHTSFRYSSMGGSDSNVDAHDILAGSSAIDGMSCLWDGKIRLDLFTEFPVDEVDPGQDQWWTSYRVVRSVEGIFNRSGGLALAATTGTIGRARMHDKRPRPGEQDARHDAALGDEKSAKKRTKHGSPIERTTSSGDSSTSNIGGPQAVTGVINIGSWGLGLAGIEPEVLYSQINYLEDLGLPLAFTSLKQCSYCKTAGLTCEFDFRYSHRCLGCWPKPPRCSLSSSYPGSHVGPKGMTAYIYMAQYHADLFRLQLEGFTGELPSQAKSCPKTEESESTRTIYSRVHGRPSKTENAAKKAESVARFEDAKRAQNRLTWRSARGSVDVQGRGLVHSYQPAIQGPPSPIPRTSGVWGSPLTDIDSENAVCARELITVPPAYAQPTRPAHWQQASSSGSQLTSEPEATSLQASANAQSIPNESVTRELQNLASQLHVLSGKVSAQDDLEALKAELAQARTDMANERADMQAERAEWERGTWDENARTSE